MTSLECFEQEPSSYRQRTETDFQPRRSLRIFAKKKLREELQLSVFSVPVLASNPSSVSDKQGSNVDLTSEKSTSTDGGASSRKRKRLVSPTSLSIPRKQAKRYPSNNISRGNQDQAETRHCVIVVNSPEQSSKKKGRSKEAKVEKGVSCASKVGEGEPDSEEGKCLGASTDKRRQKRKKRPRRLKETELASVLSGSDIERSSSSKGKAKQAFIAGKRGHSRGKQRRRVGWKKESAVNLLMASPE